MGDHKLFLYPLSRSYVHQNVTPIAGIHFFYLTAAVPNYRELRTPVYLWRTEYQFELQKYYGLDVFSLLIKELIKLHVPYFCALQKHVICWSRSTKKFFLCCSYISTWSIFYCEIKYSSEDLIWDFRSVHFSSGNFRVYARSKHSVLSDEQEHLNRIANGSLH